MPVISPQHPSFMMGLPPKAFKQAVFCQGCLPYPLKIPLHHNAVVPSLLTPRRRVASSTNVTVPTVSSSADAAIEDFTVPWQGALTWYYQPSQLDQGFFKRCYSYITHHFVLASPQDTSHTYKYLQPPGCTHKQT